MSRKRTLVALIAFALLGVPVVPALGASVPPPRSQLRLFVCQHARAPRAREVSVTAVMRPLKGTMKMAVKFELLTKRRATGHFRPVHAGDLGRWSSPRNPTLGQLPGDIWNIDHPVFGIGAPAYYRFRVSFRWTDSTGKVLGLVVRRSPVCFQPELRPDLLVRQFIVGPASSGQNRYTAVIHNRGVSAAGPFDVELEGAGPTQTQSFAGLGPRQTVRVTFIGDVCASAGPVTVTVDPGHLVDDYDRRNNTSTAACSTAPNARRPTLHSVKQ